MSTSVGTWPGSILERSLSRSESAPWLRALAVLLAAALTAASAQFTVPLPWTPVPFVLTPLIVLLTGAALGSRLGFAAQAAYLVLGMTGAPVFAPSGTLPPGALRLIGPTGGYLMAYPLAAFVTGWLAERGWDRRYLSSAAAMLAGLAIIFAGGVSWLVVLTHSPSQAISWGLAQFLALDVLKVAAAAIVLPQTWRVVGRASEDS